MIITKLISGLGNQLFQYVLARQLSIQNGDDLTLDTSFFAGQNLRSYKLYHYNINAGLATEHDIEKITGVYQKYDLYSKVYRRVENRLPKQYKRYYKESQWWEFEPSVFKIKGNVFLDGYWQHYKYFENIHPHVFDELTLKDTNELNDNSFYKQVIADKGPVSLHIRRGDYVTDKDANNLMGVLPLSYYQKAIKYISERVEQPSFYIFSDDLEWAKDNLVIDFPVNFVDIENGSKDYLELAIMSACKHNILANSSFSWWGAFLNQNKGKIVISPSNWISDVSINSKTCLQFPSWVKI